MFKAFGDIKDENESKNDKTTKMIGQILKRNK
jgi:hypothetical protein